MASDLGEVVEAMVEGILLSESSLRCSFTWAGDEYPCAASAETEEQVVDDGGMRLVNKVQIKVRVEVFPDGIDIPRRGHTVLYKKNFSATARQYKIARVTDHYGAVLELNCESPNKGA